MTHFIFELIGTVAFAASGALLGIKKKMDIFGVAMLGVTTAVGGGIIRDIVIGMTPPAAFQKPVYALLATGVSLVVFLPAVRKKINLDQELWIIIDSIGLAVFTVTGVQKGAAFDNLFLAIFLGTITGVGGGVLRDVFAGEIPMIFVKHFYACACIIGAFICAVLTPVNAEFAAILGIAAVLLLRLLAAKYKWHLPKA